MDKLKTMEAVGDENFISEILIEWNKKSQNKDLKAVSNAFCRLFMYTNGMESEILQIESKMACLMASKNRAIKQKRKLENELEEIKKILTNEASKNV
jgi:hypothetical protein